MRRLLLALSIALVAAPSASGQARAEAGSVLLVERELERMASRDTLWPGFDPMAVPLAVYSAQRTFLFRHPRPPAEFAVPEEAGADYLVHAGRHPAVSANTSAEIGGVATATILFDARGTSEREAELAAVAIHEAFHVYQGAHPESWPGADESSLFLYPFEDESLLTLRRLETNALRLALAGAAETRRAWARRAMALRLQRFAAMEPEFVDYERGTERIEGLAAYVQSRALGRATVLPAGGYPVQDVRKRAYDTGAALAVLLDGLDPGWTSTWEARAEHDLDALLQELLAESADGRDLPSIDPARRDDIERSAREDVALLHEHRQNLRAGFDARPGWRLVVEAAVGSPLWPQGFDPLNVERIDGGVLHQRFLRAGNASGALEAIDGEGVDLEALTAAAGAHPLLEGYVRVEIAGLSEPRVDTDDGTVSLRAPGLEASFEGASAALDERTWTVRLGAGD